MSDKETKKLSNVKNKANRLYREAKTTNNDKKLKKAKELYTYYDTSLELKRIEAKKPINHTKNININTTINSNNKKQNKTSFFSNNKVTTRTKKTK